ncbi:MAG TPA: hypothetical protein VEB43_20265 [Anaeromyxobacter sp.]|nr:hypothetical protein [Anaeromyxobacter sp.]
MNASLTGPSLALHNLGLAAGFGGSLFGQMALHPAVRTIDDHKERGQILQKAWRGFSPANAFAIGAVALTWLTGRAALSGGEIDRRARAMVLAKDALVAAYAGTGIASIVIGLRRGKREPPMEAGGVPAPETAEEDARAMKTVNWLGRANILAGAGIISLTALLNIKAGQSGKWNVIARLLP